MQGLEVTGDAMEGYENVTQLGLQNWPKAATLGAVVLAGTLAPASPPLLLALELVTSRSCPQSSCWGTDSSLTGWEGSM